MDNEYLVNWKNHSKHVCKGFSSLLENNYLTDVTLYCEGKKIGAHRMVLSICSSYFNDVFKEMPSGQHPLIILYGVKYEILMDILQFIYKGEANIDNSKLETFLKVSQMFQINGLTEDKSQENTKIPSDSEFFNESAATSSFCDEQRGVKRTMDDLEVEVQNKYIKNDSRSSSPSPSFIKIEPSEDDAKDPLQDSWGNTDIEDRYLQEAEENLFYDEEEIEEIETKSEMEISPETEREVGEDSSRLIPEKSRNRYEKEWLDFNEWREKEASRIVLNEAVVLEYFSSLSQKFKSSSLWTKFSMLKKALIVNGDVDISRFKKVMAFMRNQHVNYVPRKSKNLSPEQCRKFLLEASDDFLLTKVVLIFGLYGACRLDELVKLTVDDIEDHEKYALVKLQDADTHTTRTFIIPDADGGGSFNPYESYKKYAKLRPRHVAFKRFFLSYKDRKCVAQPCGIHTIAAVPKKVAKFLGLDHPEDFTGNGLKRIGAKWLQNPGEMFI